MEHINLVPRGIHSHQETSDCEVADWIEALFTQDVRRQFVAVQPTLYADVRWLKFGSSTTRPVCRTAAETVIIINLGDRCSSFEAGMAICGRPSVGSGEQECRKGGGAGAICLPDLQPQSFGLP